MKLQSILTGLVLSAAAATSASAAQAITVSGGIFFSPTAGLSFNNDVSEYSSVNGKEGSITSATNSFKLLAGLEIDLLNINLTQDANDSTLYYFDSVESYAHFGTVTLQDSFTGEEVTGELTIDLLNGGTLKNRGSNSAPDFVTVGDIETRFNLSTATGTLTGTSIITNGKLFASDANDNFALFEGQVELVPEPLTVIGTGMALGFGGLFQREYSKRQKKEKKS